MDQNSVAGMVNVVSMFVSVTVMSFLFLYILLSLISWGKNLLLKQKLRKIDLRDYDIIGTSKKGYPAVLQGKKNKNDLIFL